MKETIHFKKQRELGTILSDIFKFLRLHWKPLMGLILKIAGPALIILVIAYIYYMQAILGGMGVLDSFNMVNNFGTTALLSILILLVSAITYYSLLNGIVLHYIKSYIENNGIVNLEAVKAGVREDFWRLVLTSFVVGFIVSVGTVFCIIPGIYLWVALSIAYAVVVFESRDVMDTISYCFNLIKNEWWSTFATLVVVFLLYYFITMIFQVPQYIYFFVKTMSMRNDFTANPAAMFDWVYVLLTTVALIFQYLLYVIIALCGAFIYFNLHEKKFFTGTMETIDSLGERDDF